MNKKYGIYLTYAPEQNIRNQGLGRLLAFIIKGAINNGTTLVLAYPKWYHPELQALCEDHDIDINKIEIITTDGIPFLIRIKSLLEKLGKKEKKNFGFIKKLVQKTLNAIANLGIQWLGISNPLVFVFFGIIILTIGIVLSPLAFILFLSYIMIILGKKITKKILLRTIQIFNLGILFSSLKSLKNNMFAYTIYEKILKQESIRLSNKINKRSDISAWLIPTLFWPDVKFIKSKKVIVAPDIIFYDFATQYNTPIFSRTNHKLQHTISVADHLITYSKYVKESHLQLPFGIENSKVTVIHHGASDLSEDLKDSDGLSILKEYQKTKLKNDDYLSDFNLDDIQYIFFPSQVRAHKNFLNLLKAYKILLRERFVNIKLITTAYLDTDEEIKKYIKKERLSKDVLGIQNVSSKVLAALNAHAVCSVNPTLFEGGFPFTFMEAYTVGTPSIMGDIPMTKELIYNQELGEKMLFNPYSVRDMADKIEWGIKNKDKLYKMQNELYEQFTQRTWEDCAAEYMKVLDDVSK